MLLLRTSATLFRDVAPGLCLLAALLALSVHTDDAIGWRTSARATARSLSDQERKAGLDAAPAAISAHSSTAALITFPERSTPSKESGNASSSTGESRKAANAHNLEIAREFYAEAERFRAEWKADSLRKALEKYQLASEHFKAAQATVDEAKALKSMGEVSSLLGNYEDAQKYLALALKGSRLAGDHNTEVEALNGIGLLSALRGKNDEAIVTYQKAIDLARSANFRKGEAWALCLIGEAHYNLNNLKLALSFLTQAKGVFAEIDEPGGQAEALQYLGYLDSDSSNLRSALDHYQQALPLWRKAGNLRGEARTINGMGLISWLLGEKQKATDFYKQAEGLFRQIGDRAGLVTALNGRGAVYASLGSEQALFCHREALQLSKSAGTLEGQIVSLRYLGNAYRRLGEKEKSVPGDNSRRFYNQSLDCHTQALSLSRRIKDERIESYVLRDLGDLSDSLGDKKQAISFYDQAIVYSRKVRDRRGEASILNSRGAIYQALGAISKALEDFSRALPLTRGTEDRPSEARTLYHLAQLHRDSGNADAAVKEIEAAVTLTEALRIKVASDDLRAAYFASARQYYELNVELLSRLHKERPAAGFANRAFEVSERARARSLLELLYESHTDIKQGVDPLLLEKEKAIEETLNAKAERHAGLIANETNSAEADEVAREIDQLTTEYDEVKARIRSTSPQYAGLVQPQPLTLIEIQQRLLDDDTLLLEYMLGDEQSYLWVVSRTEVSIKELPARAQITSAVQRYYDLVTARQPKAGETFQEQEDRANRADTQLAEETSALSQILLGPLNTPLKARHLIIVPDGALQYIPFQALSNVANSGFGTPLNAAAQRPLIMDYEIINEPSASTLALVLSESAGRRAASGSVAILADPVFDLKDSRLNQNVSSSPGLGGSSNPEALGRSLRDVGVGDAEIPRLLSSGLEADAIMSVVPWRSGLKAVGFQANRNLVTGTDLSQYRIVHFATHALLNNDHPELSGIVLSLVDQQGKRQDGYLRLHDIYNLKLPVDLVVLSACQTGLGKDVKGEGLIGLTRGFMYAGASGFVASLWKVDDDATAELMKHFYAAMFQKGLSPAAALREAQLAVRTQPRWQHPFYWAGFVIQGQYTTAASPARYRVGITVATFGGLVALLALALIFLSRRRQRERL